MAKNEKVQHCFLVVKALFLIQGLLLLFVGLKDAVLYTFLRSEAEEKRIINVAWLVVVLSVIQCVGGVVSFYRSCKASVYTPIVCFVLWSVWPCGAAVYHIVTLRNSEQLSLTHLTVSVTLVAAYGLVMISELICHVILILIQKGQCSGKKYKHIEPHIDV